MKNNSIIREAQGKTRMYSYEIAKLLNVSEATFGRMMRNELPIEEQKRIAAMILDGAGGTGITHDGAEG